MDPIEMHDIVAISNSIGHLNVFITITCNPNWPEVQTASLSGQKTEDRLDLCDRMFRMNLKLLLAYLHYESFWM